MNVTTEIHCDKCKKETLHTEKASEHTSNDDDVIYDVTCIECNETHQVM
jgi:hypothetical protein